eukprot:TRINITY_DN4691_c0_g1_i1.p2 TRINITY_DN4691_c0_g1~~TRINITY_DN4691_c0_g1_i1.p2  ORF type:complete len:123 (-),score=20.03 TRINITY_DN4691_c0_g1_i1:141-509(-)
MCIRDSLPDEEDFEQGKLGKDFAGVTTLSIAEVYHLLKKEKDKPSFQPNVIFDSTFEYVSRFNKFINRDDVSKIRKILERFGLEEYETSALWNLGPATVAEAKELIPTLETKQQRNFYLQIF